MRASPVACLALLVVAIGCSSPASDEPGHPACPRWLETSHGVPRDVARALDGIVATSAQDTHAPGVAAGVVLPGLGRWYGAAGIVDVATNLPITPGAGFRIGSVTKTFTAAVVFQLAEEGKLSIDDTLDQHVPGFALGPEVTLRALLGHTAGVYNYTNDPAFLVKAQAVSTPTEVIEFALSHPAPGPPGGQYQYSNTDYFLLGMVIEAVEGRPYQEVVRSRLLQPLDLDATYLDQVETGECLAAKGHLSGGSEDAFRFSMSWAWAAGGLVSTVDQLCDWLAALYAGEAIDAASRAAMFEVSALSEAAGDPYGLGAMFVERGGRRVVGHTGSTMGFNGEVFLDLASGVCVAVQTNDFVGSHEAVSWPLWNELAARGLLAPR